MRRSCARCDKNRSIQARWSARKGPEPRLSARERVGHEFPNAREKFRAHSRVKALGIAGSDRQDPQAALQSQRSERDRADFVRILAEQVIALRIADLTAPRLAGLHQGFKALDVGAAWIAGPQKSPGGRLE